MQMTVHIADPSMPVSVSDAACEHFRRQIRAANALGVRLSVKESGCTGFMYVVDLVDRAPADDLVLEPGNGVTLFIDKASLSILRGTRIDYVREGLNSVLRFGNPNAKDYCGCGESFSIDEVGS